MPIVSVNGDSYESPDPRYAAYYDKDGTKKVDSSNTPEYYDPRTGNTVNPTHGPGWITYPGTTINDPNKTPDPTRKPGSNTKTCKLQINYYANGGTGTPPAATSQTYSGKKQQVTMKETVKDYEGLTRTGYYFLGWATSANATTPSYDPGREITNVWDSNSGGVVTYNLYAVWTNKSVYIYRPDRESNETRYKYSEKPTGKSAKLRGAIFTRTGYTQVGWSESELGPQIYSIGQSVTANSDAVKILYPVWKAKTFKVTYHPNGLDGVGAIVDKVNYDDKYTVRADVFNHPGYHVDVWNEAEDETSTSWIAGREYDWKREGDVDLYAIWEGNEYKVYYNDGFEPAYSIAVYGQPFYTERRPKSKGYRDYHTFVGWKATVGERDIKNPDGTISTPIRVDGFLQDLSGILDVEELSGSASISPGSTTQDYSYGLYLDSSNNLYACDDQQQLKHIKSNILTCETLPPPKTELDCVLKYPWMEAYSIGDDPVYLWREDIQLTPVWNNNYPYGTIFFDGEYASDHGIHVEEFPTYFWPEYENTHQKVRGLNGDVLVDPDRFENVKKTYKVSFYDDDIFYTATQKLSDWLHHSFNKGYVRLEDSYEPDSFMMAVYEETQEAEDVVGRAGKAEITFNCKPQRFLISGERKIDITASGQKIINPTNYPAKPLITFVGEGSLFINDVEIVVFTNFNKMTIDTETFDATGKGGTNMNYYIAYEDPVFLKPGENVIKYTGTISKISIIPRWWKV